MHKKFIVVQQWSFDSIGMMLQSDETVNNIGNETSCYIWSAVNALGKGVTSVGIFRNAHVTIFVHVWRFPSGDCHTSKHFHLQLL